jgi:hypothetical protein
MGSAISLLNWSSLYPNFISFITKTSVMKKLLILSASYFLITSFVSAQEIVFKKVEGQLVRDSYKEIKVPIDILKKNDIDKDQRVVLSITKNTDPNSYSLKDETLTFPGDIPVIRSFLILKSGISAHHKENKLDTVILRLTHDGKDDLLTLLIDLDWNKRIRDDNNDDAFDNGRKIEMIQFTDFLGFENDRPNGIYQQELRFKWPLVKRWWPSVKDKNKDFYVQFFRSVIVPDVLFNRIDKAGKDINYPYGKAIAGKTTTNPDSVKPYLTTMDILKYSSLQLSGRIVPVTIKAGNLRVQFQYSFTIFRNRPFITDTVYVGLDSAIRTQGDFRAVYSFAHKAELYFKTTLNNAKDLNIVGVAGVMWLRLKDSYYKQFDAAVVDPFNKATTLLPIGDAIGQRKVQPIWYYSTRLEKRLGEEKKNNIFLRFNYTYQKGKYNAYVGRPTPGRIPQFERAQYHNHFLQIQAGFGLDVEEIFKKE